MADPTKTEKPFFSVIIPTMNRPYLLEATLKSALWQTFKDFDVIVSDNSNSEEMRGKNLEIIRNQEDQARLRYVRPEHWLNMPDHFEFASLQAKGTYVLILTDRRVMLPHALGYLHTQIKAAPEGIDLVSWYDHWIYSDLSGMVTGGPFKGGAKVLKSLDLTADFARFEQWKEGGYWSQQLPHTCNGCYSSELAQKIRGIYGKLFMPVSPDFLGAFLMMAHTPEVLYLDSPLYLQHTGRFLGNGSASFLEGVEGYTRSFPDVDPYEGTPARLNTLFNTLARDFLKAKEMVGEKFSGIKPNWVGYYVSNYLEIMDKEKMGSGMDLSALYSLWFEGVGRLSPEEQAQTRKILEGYQGQKASWIPLRRWVRQMGLAPQYSVAVGKIRNLRQRMGGKPVYDNVFEAATLTDHLQSGDPSLGNAG